MSDAAFYDALMARGAEPTKMPDQTLPQTVEQPVDPLPDAMPDAMIGMSTQDQAEAIPLEAKVNLNAMMAKEGPSPDEYAKQRQLAREIGAPPEVVGFDPQTAEGLALKARMNDIIQRHPDITKFFADPKNFKLAYDDIPAVSSLIDAIKAANVVEPETWMETLKRSLKGVPLGWERGQAGQELLLAEDGPYAISRVLALRRTLDLQAAAEADPAIANELGGNSYRFGDPAFERQRAMEQANGPEAQAARAAWKSADIAARENASRATGLQGFAGNAVGGIANMLPMLGASMATKRPWAALLPMWYLSRGDAYAQDRADGLSIEAAGATSQVRGLAEVAFENIPLGILTKEGGTLIGRALKTAGAEFAQEDFTELVNIGLDAGILNKEMTVGDAVQRLIDAGVMGATVGLGLGGIAHGVHAGIARMMPDGIDQRVEAYKQSELAVHDAQMSALTDIINAAQATKLAQRDPSVLSDLIAGASNDGKMYVAPEALAEYFQSQQDVDPEAMLASLDLTMQSVIDAQASGDYVEVPLAKFAAMKEAADLQAALADDIKLAPHLLTRREIDEYASFLGDLAHGNIDTGDQEENAQPENVDRVAREGADAIYDDVFQQLTQTGRFTPDAAHANAAYWRAAFTTLAARTGNDVGKLYDRFKPVIQARMQGGKRQEIDLDMQLNKLRSPKTEFSKTPMLDAIRKKGGVKIGSTLAGELQNMGVTPKTHPGLFRKGRGLGDVDNFVQSRDDITHLLAVDPQHGYVDPAEIYRAIGEELAGRPMRTPDEQAIIDNETDGLDQLSELLGMVGVDDVSKFTNEQIKERIRQAHQLGDLPQMLQGLRPRYAVEFTRLIDRLAKNEMGRYEDLPLGPTPQALRLAGLPDMQLFLTQREARKNIAGKHEDATDIEVMRRLPDLMANPIMAFKQDDGRIAVLLDAVDKSGNPVIVVVQPNGVHQRGRANMIVTVHGRTANDKMLNAVRDGNVTYRQEKRSQEWLVKAWEQSPGKEPKPDFADNIPTEANLVNEAGKTYFQGQPVATDTQEFKKWFGDSKVVDERGDPLVVYHGTTHDFEAFNKSRANIENDFGAGYYFTNETEDVSENYAGEGPDLTSRIEMRVDELANDDDLVDQYEQMVDSGELEGVSFDEYAREIAREQLNGGAPNVMPVYLSMQNPVEIGSHDGRNGTVLDHEFVYDEDGEDIIDERGSLIDFVNVLRDIASEYDVDGDAIAAHLIEASSGEGLTARQIVDELANSDLVYAQDYESNNGASASKEAIRRAFEEIGFDGIIDYTVNEKFGSERRVGKSMAGMNEGTVHYIAFKPEQIKSVFNRGTFDANDARVLYQPDGTGARGSFQIAQDRSTRIINLFESADSSTFLHESSHFFLEVLRDLSSDPGAPQQLMSDVDAIFKWMGIQSWDDLETKHHEQWARASEAYVMEGKAPSEELRGIFRRFADWLSSIYKSIKALNVNLTPEIKGVMDRMLATDEQIALARMSGEFLPMFKDARTAGLTDAEFAAYTKLAEKAEGIAREKMISKLMRDIKKERSAEFEAALTKAKQDVADEYSNSPVWRAIHYFTTGEFLNADDTMSGIEAIKLRRDQVSEIIGAENLSLLPRNAMASGKDGLNPEVAAGVFGFRHADQMLRSIMAEAVVRDGKATYPSFDKAVDAEARRRVEADMGLSLDPERIRQEAASAMHNVDRGALLVMEMNILRKLGAKAILEKGAKRSVADEGAAKGQAAAEQTGADQSLGAAVEMGGDQDVRRAEMVALSAEARSGAIAMQNRAQNAAARQTKDVQDIPPAVVRAAAQAHVQRMTLEDLNALAKFRQNELRAARNVELAIAKRDYAKASTYKWQQLWNHYVYLEALDAVDARDSFMREAGRISKIRDYRNRAVAGEYIRAQQELLAAYKLGPAWLDTAAMRRDLFSRLDALRQAHTLGGYQDILLPSTVVLHPLDFKAMTYDHMQQLRDAVKSIGKAGRDASDASKAAFKQHILDITSSIEANNKAQPKRPIHSRKNWEQFKQTSRDLWQGFDALLMKADFIARDLDGGKMGGIVQRNVVEPIMRSASDEAAMREKAGAAWKRIMDIQRGRSSGWWTKLHYIQGAEPMTMNEILAVALNSGNLGNIDALLNGGHPWLNENVHERILEKLDDTDWQFVEAIWDHIDTYWPQIKALEEKMTGVAPAKVAPTPFVTPTGRQMRGGYYPIKFDGKREYKSMENEIDELMAGTIAGSSIKAATSHGHTNERVGNNGKPVKLDLSVAFDHERRVIHDLAFRENVYEVSRVLRSKAFTEAVSGTIGMPYMTALDSWLKYAAAGEMEPLDAAQRFLKHARLGISIAELGYSFTTVLAQPTAISQAAVAIGEDWAAKGVAKFYAAPLESSEFIYASSPMMRDRNKAFDQNANDQLTSMKPGGGMHAFRQAAFWMVSKADLAVSLPVWLGAYGKAMSGKADNYAATHEEAVAFADMIVRTSQGSGRQVDLAQIQTGNEYKKIFFAFGTFFAAYHNMQMDAFKRAGRTWDEGEHLKASLMMARDVLWLTVFPAIVSSLILGRGPDDKKKEGWAAWAGKQIASYGFGGVPFARDAIQGAVNDFGFSGPPLMRLLEGSGELLTLADGEGKRKAVKDSAMFLAYMAHLPARQAIRTLDYLDHYNQGQTKGGEFQFWQALTGYKKP